jgi:hypothetical protein
VVYAVVLLLAAVVSAIGRDLDEQLSRTLRNSPALKARSSVK